MSRISGNPTPTDKLIYRLRLMGSSGGMLTRDRVKTIMEAADRLEEYDERISIMTESGPVPDFPGEVGKDAGDE